MKTLTDNQQNVYAALRGMIRRDRPWLRHDVLASYDGRTIAALMRHGLLEVDLQYGIRLKDLKCFG